MYLGGIIRARSPQAPKARRGVPKSYENDGRAPDTVERLGLVPPTNQSQHPVMRQNDKVAVLAYRWNGANSCFFDGLLELVWAAGRW